MITTMLKPETSPSTPLSNVTSEEEPTLSFGKLLSSIDSEVDSSKSKHGHIVLSLKENVGKDKDTNISTKNEALLSLLKNDKAPQNTLVEPLELNPMLSASMSEKELKILVSDAKEYLKDKILQSPEYKKSQITELPKTLKGLAKLADTFGINVSKISVEEVQVKKGIKSETLDLKETLKTETVNAKEALKTEIKAETLNVKAETKTELKTETINVKEILKTEIKTEITNAKEPKNIKPQENIVAEFSRDEKKEEQVKKQVHTPLFKAQASTDYTTEQLVASKLFKVDETSPKSKANETLKLLLRGEKSSSKDSNLTADFSVNSARVTPPRATTEITSIETLLHGESSETSSKLDGLNIHKADSFEVKLNEAKQMIKYLSTDVKTAIEDYKSPFTRVKIQLNPQRLGEIDLTIVQRGKNLHINLSSNSAAINTLSMNVNELKVQLNNSGINNASLNFNNSSQSDNSNASGQQQSHQNERQAQDEYTYFESEETNEEILSSLEIIVPDYA